MSESMFNTIFFGLRPWQKVSQKLAIGTCWSSHLSWKLYLMSLRELLQESMFKSFLCLCILLSLPIPCQFSVFHGSRHPSIPSSSYGWAAATLAAGGRGVPIIWLGQMLKLLGQISMCYFHYSKPPKCWQYWFECVMFTSRKSPKFGQFQYVPSVTCAL